MDPRSRTVALVLAGLVAASGCGSAQPSSSPQAQAAAVRTTPGDLPVVPAEAGHLHGMGVDPADGTLYLGTHVGLMTVDEGGVERVGDATVDLMGFAVAGPKHFYASGHPGPGDDLPDPVGLIETVDGGESWRALSLGGSSDFHTLTAGSGRVYGYDGVVRSTSDGRTWSAGTTDVRPASLAVSPEDADTVIATTEHGPVISTDGGATFTHLPSAPLLVFVAWTGTGLWGVTPDGTVHHSSDGGTGWQARASIGGPPEAFTVDGSTVLAATADRIVTGENGRGFTTLARRAAR